MPTLVFKNKGITVEVRKGQSILEAAIEHKVPLYHTCGGNCSCSTCRVQVLSGEQCLSRMEDDEKAVLDSFDLKAPHRLGCQSLILRDGVIEVDIPERDKAPRVNKTPPVPGEMR